MGYTGSLYHAWVSVYIEGQGWVDNIIYFDGYQWKLMDPTFASSGKNDPYEKEHIMRKNMKNAVTYTAMMTGMLLIVLLVLFTRVMPVFEKVYKPLGAQMPPVSIAATRLGGIFCAAALVIILLLGIAAFFVWIMGRNGKKLLLAERPINWLKRRSKIAKSIANRCFTAVLSLTLKSGLDLEKGMELAGELVENPAVEEKIRLQ